MGQRFQSRSQLPCWMDQFKLISWKNIYYVYKVCLKFLLFWHLWKYVRNRSLFSWYLWDVNNWNITLQKLAFPVAAFWHVMWVTLKSTSRRCLQYNCCILRACNWKEVEVMEWRIEVDTARKDMDAIQQRCRQLVVFCCFFVSFISASFVTFCHVDLTFQLL